MKFKLNELIFTITYFNDVNARGYWCSEYFKNHTMNDSKWYLALYDSCLKEHLIIKE